MAAIGGALNGCGRLPIFADAGSVGTGGSTTTGGTTGTAGASGGGGAAGGGNTAGAGGSSGSGTGGSTHTPGFGEPACARGAARLTPCDAPGDLQFCYSRCGPENVGVRALTCQTTGQLNGVYDGMSACVFDPVADHSCYKIPTAANAACPQGVTLQASMPCQVDHCVLCNSLGGLAGGNYFDSAGAPKTGWCVCQLPNDAGLRTWNCASDSLWPCPAGNGC